MMQFRTITIAMMTGLILCLVTVINSPAYCADVAKIGTISFQKIFDNSIAGKAAKEEINKEGMRMEADLKSKGDEITSLQEMLDKDEGIMSKEARDEKSWQLNRLVDDVKALKRKYDHQIQEFQMKRVNQIKKEVLDIINTYGKKEGYLLILENIGVIYAPQSLDITDQIIQTYDSIYSKKNKKK
jgi:outer membrane protein